MKQYPRDLYTVFLVDLRMAVTAVNHVLIHMNIIQLLQLNSDPIADF